ncbi:hypothetical protein ACFQ2J_09855 [Thalassobacillus hwangdonensis]|uniref:Uncharacterized protein n=1 Tax=Thalassobacillus hwangdonensis TaxID=546108 RepID=A0ABW3L2X7_9BACI
MQNNTSKLIFATLLLILTSILNQVTPETNPIFGGISYWIIFAAFIYYLHQWKKGRRNTETKEG